MRTILILCLLAAGLSAGVSAQTDTARIIEAGNAELTARRYAEAERLYRQALALYEAQDPAGQNTGVALNNLGLALEYQRKFAEAEAAYLRAHAIRLTLLGGEHADTLSTLINIGDVQQAQSKFTPATTCGRRRDTPRPSRCFAARWRSPKRGWVPNIRL